MATQNDTNECSSQELRTAVDRALSTQRKRFGNEHMRNALMRPDNIEKFCVLTDSAQGLIKKVFAHLQLSVRGYHKILKAARTIADLSGSDKIDGTHVREAVMYRSLDRVLERTRQ